MASLEDSAVRLFELASPMMQRLAKVRNLLGLLGPDLVHVGCICLVEFSPG